MNKEELLKEFNAKVEDLRQELLEKLKSIDEKNDRFQAILPKEHDKFYYIDDITNEINLLYFEPFDRKRFLTGRLFKTEEEAEQHLRESELLFRIKKWAEIHNEGWKPDWSNLNELRYTIFYSDEKDELLIACSRSNRDLSILPAFKSTKIAREFIKEFEEEIKEILL